MLVIGKDSHVTSKRPVKRVGFAVTLFLILGVAYWWLRPGRLVVRTNPANATVKIDGEAVGETTEDGLDLRVSRGRHVLRLEREGSEPVEVEIVIVGESITIERTLAPSGMVFIEGGSFTMGDDDGPFNERPAHRVTLRSFFIDHTEVTIGVFRAHRASYAAPFAGDRMPATNVSWHEAVAFCEWMGKRLPTEAEWERACRGNTDAAYGHAASFDTDRARVGQALDAGPVAVGNYGASTEGVFDLTGNVWEWCADWYDRNAYRHGDRDNPSGSTTGSRRVLRGGAWYSNERFARCTHRPGNFRAVRDPSFGFRCVKDVILE